MQMPLYIEEEIKVGNQIFIRIGFSDKINKVVFREIMQMFDFYGCYYLHEENSWFVSKKIWKEGIWQLKKSNPHLFYSNQKSIQEKLAQAIKIGKPKF